MAASEFKQLKQEVMLEVWDSPDGGTLVFSSNGLKVDFDVRQIPEFNRGKFVITNLNEATTKRLVSGEKYVTLKTRLGGGKQYTVANRYYISNAVDELKLPERVLTLFCFDKLRKEVLEKRVSETVLNPTLKRMVAQLLATSGFKGDIVYSTFPAGYVDDPGRRSSRPLNGSVQQCLRRLEKEFGFNTYTVNGNIHLMHKPDLNNVNVTGLDDKAPDVVLKTDSMRSNPKIGIANAVIDSNLDPRITPTMILDLSNLLTVGVIADQNTLELVDEYLENFSGYSKYQTFAVQHKGSNYTAEWNSIVNALSPTSGKLMPTVAWANKTY